MLPPGNGKQEAAKMVTRHRNGRIPLSVEGIESALKQRGTQRARREYVESLRSRITKYEYQYSLPSAHLHTAISGNRLRETADVAKWSLAYEALRRLENGRSPLAKSRKISGRRAASRK